MTRTPKSARFCERIGIDEPIVLAPMGGGPSTPELVAAVAEAGGLGSIAAGYLSPDALVAHLERTRRLTRGSLAVNIFVPPDRPLKTELSAKAAKTLTAITTRLSAPAPVATLPDPTTFEDQVAVAAASDATVVSFTFGIPSESVLARLHAAGKIVAATANTFDEAAQVAEAGCDAVILQGFEAGAHRGGISERGDRHVGLIALLEQARGRLDVDVIASGGVTSGAGVAACLALGAVAVQIGTAFLVTDESGATAEWKKAVLTCTDADTVVTAALTGRGARAVRNELVDQMTELGEDLPDYPVLNSFTSALRQRAKELGDPEYQSLWTGQAGSAARTGAAADTFERLVAELDAAIGAFGDRRGPDTPPDDDQP